MPLERGTDPTLLRGGQPMSYEEREGEEWVINKPIVDLRQGPSFRSERVSQALLFTTCRVLKVENQNQEEWVFIQTPDEYTGWIPSRHLTSLRLERPEWKVHTLIAPVFDENGGLLFHLPFDVRIPGDLEGEYVRFLLPDGQPARIPSREVKRVKPEPLNELLRQARRFMGIPYLWGGISTFGFDCSGFIQRLFHYCGIQLPRDSAQQRQHGQKVTTIEELAPGDLVCFPGHIGLYLGQGWMIHASLYLAGVGLTNLFSSEAYSTSLRQAFLEGRRII